MLRVEEAAKNSKTIWCGTKKSCVRVCMYACMRECALGPLGKLDAASAGPASACVRAHRAHTFYPSYSLGWANISGAGILRSHNLRSCSVMGLLATSFVSKPGNGFIPLQPARI